MRNGAQGPAPFELVLDMILQRYHWDWWTYQAQPEEFVQECIMVMSAEGEHHAAEEHRRKLQRRRGGSGPYGPAPRPTAVPPSSHEELMQLAAREGFFDPPEN